VSQESVERTQRNPGRAVPQNLEAEECLIGCLMLSRDSIAASVPIVTAGDFYKPAHGLAFDTIAALHAKGRPADPVTIKAELERQGTLDQVGGAAWLVSVQARAGATTSAAHYATIVAEHAVLRRLLSAASEITELAYSLPEDVAEAVGAANALVSSIEMPAVEEVAGLSEGEEFAFMPDNPHDWVIPGLLDHGDRLIVVAPEGGSKSTLLRTFGCALPYGLHPFTGTTIPPMRTLVVDLENPARTIRGTMRPFVEECARRSVSDLPWKFWHRPGGIDLRSRRGVAELNKACEMARPDLIAMGPIYKTHRKDSNKRADEVAEEVAFVLDDVRTRFGCAVVLEHHAPLAQNGHRELRPFGALTWSQWPEFGLALTPEDQTRLSLKVSHWRGQRDERPWPERLTRSKPWLWKPGYADGVIDDSMRARQSAF
jgi:DnaB helicase-like protein/AAA domain-containing protein